jgi:hypothetical protein
MKYTNFLVIICLLFPLVGISQNQTVMDDIYFKANNPKNFEKSQIPAQQFSNYKKGAKEIVFIEKKSTKPAIVHDTVYVVGEVSDLSQNNLSKNNYLKDKNENGQTVIHDTIYVTDQTNDSVETNSEHGYYLNGFNGNQSDLEYAERIRRFHNPRYAIFIGDPRYNDIYFLNNNDWNVYVDDSYAYVTPTWTNPYWWNYNINPYDWGNWGLGFGNGWYSPYSYYSGWYNPWGYNGFYGGFGGYYGDYFGYDGYGGYYGYNSYGYQSRSHTDSDNRQRNATSSRTGGYGATIGGSSMSSRAANNQYTVLSNGNSTSSGRNTRSNVGSTVQQVAPTTFTSRSGNGIGIVRNSYTRGYNQPNNTNVTSGNYRNGNSIINTRPRTSVVVSSGNSTISRSESTNSGFERTNSYTTRSTTRSSYSAPNTSNSSTNSTPSTNYNSGNSSRSTPSYSSPSSSSSGTSYSGGVSSSSGSRSSGGGGGRR